MSQKAQKRKWTKATKQVKDVSKPQKRKRTKATKQVKDVSKPQLLVLGMHRSGTSLVTRLINLMGAWVGEPEKVANPAPDNPRGFWEYPEVKELNDWLLAEYGASWDLPLCDLSDIPNGVRATFDSRASAIIGELNVHWPWVLKDPRLCLTLPLWLDLLEMPIGVHIYRPPIEVALSLEHREGLSLSHGIALWEFYNRQALASAAGMPRVLVSLPDLRKDPLATIGRFYENLFGVGVDRLIMPEVAEIEAFIDLNFLHFQEPRETAGLMLNAAQLELVHAFESSAAFELPDAAELSEGARNILISHAYSKTVRLQKPADGMGVDAGGKLEKLQQQASLVLESHQVVAAQLAGLQQMLVQQSAQIESVNKRLGEQERKLTDQQSLQLEYANRAGESARLRAALTQVAADSVAIRGSWRWRVGNSGVRCIEWLLRRDPAPLALDNIEATSRQFGFAEYAPESSVASVADSRETENSMTGSARAEQQLQAIYNSMSWQITAPLRSVYGAFGRSRSFVNKALDARKYFGGWFSLSRQTFGVLREKGLRGLGEDIRRYHEFHPNRNPGGNFKPQSTKVPTILHPAGAPKTETVLCFPIIDWDFRFQRPQQLMRMFAQHDQQVIYVALQFGDVMSARPVESGVTELTLPAPAGLNRYRQLPDAAANDSMLEALQSYLEQYVAGPLTIIVQLPFWRDLAMRIADRRGGILIYDCMDDHAGFTTNEPEMLEAEEELIRGADLVVASSALLLKKVQQDAQQSLLLRNACDFEHFASVDSPPNAKNGEIVVGYYGAIADWFDSDLVHDIAKMRPRWRFQLIGSTYTGDVAKLKKLGNVELLGEQPYNELPELIADWHACIIPFRKLPLTEATNPVKVYEMLAAGKPVVAVPLSELTPIAEEGIIAVAESPAEFVRQIESELRKGDKRRAIGRKYAAANTWEVRQQRLTEALRLLEPLVSIIIVTFHNLELNRLCLESVLADTNYGNIEVIVVDNASEDDTPTYLQELERSDPRVRVILNDQNRGFAGANNQGLAIARGQYLCLLNNDTVVSGDWLSNLIVHLKSRPDLGMVGPVTNAIGNEAKIEVGYESLSDMSSWARQYTQSHQGVLEEISMLAMFCVVMPRYVWRRVGSLDERFGIGMFEDDDYNRRVREAGYHYGLARDSFLHHWQKSSFKLLGEGRYLKIFEDNQKKFHAKWSEQLGEEAIKEARLKTLRERSAVTAGTVIFAPSVGWGIHLFQRPHHLARLFAKMGYLVIFDCSNVYDDVDLLKEIEPNLFLFRGEPELLHGLPRTLLWTFSYNYDYCDHFPADTRVLYDWIDDLAVFPYDQEKLAHLHERGLAEADLVASVAQQLHRQALKARPDAIYLPNAVEQGRFEIAPSPNPARDDNDLRGFLSPGTRVAGYYGALAEWFDYDLLARVAKLRPDWRFLLIGPDYDQSITNSQIKSVPNIRWIGPRDYDVLPGFLHLFDVAMIPFQINDITLATSPLKLFEYFAGGRPVISTPMPECAAFDEVSVVRTAEEFSDALDQALAAGMDSDYQERLVSLTAQNTWRARVETVIAARIDLGEKQRRDQLEWRKSDSVPQLRSAAKTLGDQGSAPKGLQGFQWLEGLCNVCGHQTRFFFQSAVEYRESLVCEYCRSTSRYRSIASGLLRAMEELRGVTAPSVADLPRNGVAGELAILDTQTPFRFDLCAYPIPALLSKLDWVNLHVTHFEPNQTLGIELSPGVENQNLENLTYDDASFDILITSDVMEHVRLDDRAHAEIARVLRPNGVYLFTVPHFRDRVDSLIRVEVVDPKDPSQDRFLTDPEYHGDANSSDGRGALSYRSYGTEIDDCLRALGFSVHYSKMDDPATGRMNTELFFCAKDITLIDEAGLSDQERALHKRFIRLLNSGNRHFYRALVRHLQSLCDHPCLEMYFTFALSSNERGRQVAGLLANYVSAKGKRYLDIGCAYGGFLVAFGEFGAEPTGIDLTENVLKLAKENFHDAGVDYPLLLGDITIREDLAKLVGPFEIITCNDVIEHVTDPETTIRHVRELLADDGVAYFEIPNAEAVSAVVSDGHYQMFALTLLDRSSAAEYFSLKNPGVLYGVEHMLRLEEYRQLFKANGLEMHVLPETLSALDKSAVDTELAALERDLPGLLKAVPDSIREQVADAIRAYLEEANTARKQSARRPEDFVLRFGAGFWKILARKSRRTGKIESLSH